MAELVRGTKSKKFSWPCHMQQRLLGDPLGCLHLEETAGVSQGLCGIIFGTVGCFTFIKFYQGI